jgi:hypothetical protein
MTRLAAGLLAALACVACPASSAAPPQRELTVAAYYYPWYDVGGARWRAGYLRGRLAAPQAPALGEYDSRDPATLAAHYRWAQRYGVDVFVCSWWSPGGYEDVTIRDHLLESPARGPTRIALLYESLTRLGGTTERIVVDDAARATLVADFDYFARTYFNRPGYYRIDGRPVVFLYVSRLFRGDYAQALAAVRALVRERYGLELFLVGDEIDWDGKPNRRRIRLFEAITAYTMHSHNQPARWARGARFGEGVRTRYRTFGAAAAAEGVRLVPGALPGFNDRGVRPDANNPILPPDLPAGGDGQSLFADLLALAGRSVDPHLGLMTITSWNEWLEDTQIEPTAPGPLSAAPARVTGGHAYAAYGFGLLEALARFREAYETSGP